MSKTIIVWVTRDPLTPDVEDSIDAWSRKPRRVYRTVDGSAWLWEIHDDDEPKASLCIGDFVNATGIDIEPGDRYKLAIKAAKR